MKLVAGLVVLVALSTQAQEYRTFTAADGRKLEARIIQYNGVTGKVQIERADKKKLTVGKEAFSEEDQAYILKWEATQAFLSPSKFKLDVKRVEVGTKKKTHDVDVGEEFAGGRRGGMSGVVTMATDKTTQYKYNLILENKGGSPIKNVMVEYRIFYEQEKAVPDEKANKGRDEEDPRPERYMAVNEQKVKSGNGRMKPLEPKEVRASATTAISILKRSANRPWGDLIDLKGDVSGVWFKLTMRGVDGKTHVREIASPESVMKKFPWDPPEDEDVQIQEKP